MADGGEIAAAFRGLAESAAQAGEDIGRSLERFYTDTAERADDSVRTVLAAEEENTRAANAIRTDAGTGPDSGGTGDPPSSGASRLARMLNGESDGELAQTGGSSFRRPRNELDFETDWADHAYDKIRADPQLDAVYETASAHGFSSADVEQIYKHVFTESHELDDGVRQFDANPRMARAWERLQDGNPHPSDIDLLKHELHESNWMKENANQNYRQAHQATIDAGYTWDEDGPERDGIPYR